MKLQVGHRYLTKSGNTVKCIAKGEGPVGRYLFTCQYEKTIEGHEALIGRAQQWTDDGVWVEFPGGIHDIVKAA